MGYFSDNYNHLSYPKETAGEADPGLRKAQLGAIHSLGSHFTNSSLPALIVMPTGSGKTAVLSAVPFLLESTRVLVVTPSRLVREQIAEEIRELRTLKRLHALPAEIPPPHLIELTERVVSDEQWEALRQYDVVVAAPPSISPAYEGIPNPPSDLFDLLLVDEAHHVPAQSWQAVLNAFQAANRVLFTATPFRRDGREINGKLAYVYHVRSALEDGIFGKLKYSPALDTLDGTPEDVLIAQETQRVFDKDRAAGLRHFVMVRTDQKTRAEELRRVYSKHTSLKLQSINSSHSLKHIKKTVEKLRLGELDGVICVDMMGEGFDFPNLKIAAIHSPHRSLAITLQFIGRFARTNAPDIGTATFISVPREDGSELGALYSEGAVWQDIVTDMHGNKVKSEQENREIIETFEEPIVASLDISDVPLNAIKPSYHVRVFQVRNDIDIHIPITLPIPLEVVHQRITTGFDNAAFVIAYDEDRPLWSELDLFNSRQFELFVVYYHSPAKLLFINASRKGTSLYQHIARQYTNGNHRNVSLDRIRRVMRDIQDAQIFNFGAKNRALLANNESYRISAGPKPDETIDAAMARSHHQGHLMGSGTCDGKKVTIGYSSGSKVWSNTTSTLAEFLKWCRGLAERMLSDLPMPALSRVDLLKCGREITELDDIGVIAADWHVNAYKAHNVVSYAEEQCELLELAISIDRAPTDQHKIGIVFSTDHWKYKVLFVLNDMPQFTEQDGQATKPTVVRGIVSQPLIDYLNDHPLNFYLADFSRVSGNEHFSADLEVDVFDRELITAVDWVTANVDITQECGPNSIQEHLKTYLLKPEHEVVLHDHRTGEMADFITAGVVNDRIVMKLYHVKKSGGPEPGNRVGDVYEVCGQVVKSLVWLRKPETLLRKIKERRQGGSKWLKGDDATIEALFQKGIAEMGFAFEIVLVQPGISKSLIENKLGEVIAAASAHVKTCNVQTLHVLGSA